MLGKKKATIPCLAQFLVKSSSLMKYTKIAAFLQNTALFLESSSLSAVLGML